MAMMICWCVAKPLVDRFPASLASLALPRASGLGTPTKPLGAFNQIKRQYTAMVNGGGGGDEMRRRRM